MTDPFAVRCHGIHIALARTRAAGAALRHRHATLRKRRRRGAEAECLPDVVRYAALGAGSALAAHRAMEVHRLDPRFPPVPLPDLAPPYLPRPNPRHDHPRRGLVTARTTAALAALGVVVRLNAVPLKEIHRTDLDRARGLALDTRFAVHAAYGQLSIAHHGWLRGCYRARPLTRIEFYLQVHGIVAALAPRVPARYRPAFGGGLAGGEYRLALEDVAAVVLSHDFPITAMERHAIQRLLRRLPRPPYSPAAVGRLAVVSPAELPVTPAD